MPGWDSMQRPLVRNDRDAETQWRLDQPDLKSSVLSHIPQNEIGTVDDVAAAAEFLVSGRRRYVKRALVGSRWALTAV